MNREIELKLECEPEALDRVSRAPVLTRLKRGRASEKTLRSVYFDTEDFSLMKSGLALRVREAGGKRIQTLKTESDGNGLASDRGEWEVQLGGDEEGPDLNRLPANLKARIRKAANGAPISPRLISDIHRTARQLMTPDGDEIELAIDRGVLRANGREARVSEVELELKRGDPSSLYRLALELADLVPLRVGLRSKAERGVSLAGNERPGAIRAEAISFDRSVDVEDAYAMILRQCLTHLLLNEAVAIEYSSTEALHQMRVALRRMRSAFAAFRKVMKDETAEHLSRDAKWLATAIGRARDFDVFITTILAPLEKEEPGNKELVALREAAEKQRKRAWSGARAALRSARMSSFVLRLALYVDERGWRDDDGDASRFEAPLSEFAPKALDKYLKEATKLGRRIDELSVDERHELRKRLKKLRYTLSFFASLYRRPDTRNYLHALSELQDVFGALNDFESARKLTEELTSLQPSLSAPGARLLAYHERRARKQWQSAVGLWREFRDIEPFWR
jgi:inorganic triphosphatase YgiF